jgi:uncharacterized protein
MTHTVVDEVETGEPTPTANDRELEKRLATWFRSHGSVLVGFSGGVDSAFLACVAVDALGRDRVLAVIGRSASYPAEQWERARTVAAEFGVPVLEVATDELDDPRYAANPSNRCYFCKSELWDTLAPIARDGGFAVVVDGTNADDTTDHRPGARAANERGVRSPLAEIGLTKGAIRRLSRERGIQTWSQPASPCLSSRIPYGTQVTAERLRQIESGERAVRALGVGGDLRVRYHGDLARIELPADALGEWLRPTRRRALLDALRSAAFERVALDVRGFRSGSLNVLGGVVAEPLVRGRSAITTGDAESLARRLVDCGIACAVESRDRLAVVRCDRDADLDGFRDADVRRMVLDSGRSHGFTHVAVDLVSVDDATVRRD